MKRHPVRLAGHSLLRMQSDARLVELARAGHEPAFTAIVQRYRPALVRYCTGLLGADRAEDAVQQALANAHAALTGPDDRPLELRPWLYRLAHNAALNVLRASRDRALAADGLPEAGETPDEVLARRQRFDELVAAIAALPRGQRDSLLLRELEGRSHEEIATSLGVSVGAARQHLFRARAAVRAACTALTPVPLLARMIEFGAAPVAGSGAEVGGAVVTKAAVGLLAAGALAGGATSTGVLSGDDPPRTPGKTIAKAPERKSGPAPVERGEPASSPPRQDAAPLAGRSRTSGPPARRARHSEPSRGRPDGRRDLSGSAGSGDDPREHSGDDRRERSGPDENRGDARQRSGSGEDRDDPRERSDDDEDDDDRRVSSGTGDDRDDDDERVQSDGDPDEDRSREDDRSGDVEGGDEAAAPAGGAEEDGEERESSEQDRSSSAGSDSGSGGEPDDEPDGESP
jgi:RNA polymerase sigma factor (sigma-70 family)